MTRWPGCGSSPRPATPPAERPHPSRPLLHRRNMMKRIGVDVGGTFTDLILVDEDTGRITVDKVPSTPDDPARGVVDGIHHLCEAAGVGLSDVTNLLHGTTVATN